MNRPNHPFRRKVQRRDPSALFFEGPKNSRSGESAPVFGRLRGGAILQRKRKRTTK